MEAWQWLLSASCCARSRVTRTKAYGTQSCSLQPRWVEQKQLLVS